MAADTLSTCSMGSPKRLMFLSKLFLEYFPQVFGYSFFGFCGEWLTPRRNVQLMFSHGDLLCGEFIS